MRSAASTWVWIPPIRQARGRSRMFGTLQGRLAALGRPHMFLKNVSAHNARFAIVPDEGGTAFVPFAGDLRDILCARIASSNTVRYRNRVLQIPQDRHRHHYVRVHE